MYCEIIIIEVPDELFQIEWVFFIFSSCTYSSHTYLIWFIRAEASGSLNHIIIKSFMLNRNLAIFENSWPPFCPIWIIFTHLKLWIASARHNFKWVKIEIEQFGGPTSKQCIYVFMLPCSLNMIKPYHLCLIDYIQYPLCVMSVWTLTWATRTWQT